MMCYRIISKQFNTCGDYIAVTAVVTDGYACWLQESGSASRCVHATPIPSFPPVSAPSWFFYGYKNMCSQFTHPST
jgi:hypothetical protein